MIIAVSAQGNDLSANVDPRFGRTSLFLLVDTKDMSFQVIGNGQSLNLSRGAGIQAAQNIAKFKPDVVLTGNCGPKAFQALKAAGIDVVVGAEGIIEDEIRSFLEGKYRPAEGANVEGHWS